jgi:ammonium transporter Rh
MFASILGAFQLLILILFIVGTDYDSTATTVPTVTHYPFFQDVNAMIFIGFGFLMAAVSRYAWGATGLAFMLAALTVQWAILVSSFWHTIVSGDALSTIHLSIVSLIGGDFAAGAVLISFGAVLGRCSPTQLLVMAIVEVVVFGLNEAIGVVAFSAVDMGGSMFVHTFGAYFGVACSMVLGNATSISKKSRTGKQDAPGTSKHAGTFAMIGTLVLWIYWPSFNGALASGAQQHRVIINTTLSLCGSCIAAFIASRLLRGGKFDMEDIQNATLAGGVAVGSSADLIIQPGPAILIGMIAGFLSVAGFSAIGPFLRRTIGLDDTMGVHYLHGIPGIMGGIAGAVSASLASESVYGEEIGTIFSARAGSDPRSASDQGWFQAGALGVTLAIALVGGALTGLLMRLPVFGPVGATAETPTMGAAQFEDEPFWVMDELDHSDPNTPYTDFVAAQKAAGDGDPKQKLAPRSASVAATVEIAAGGELA